MNWSGEKKMIKVLVVEDQIDKQSAVYNLIQNTFVKDELEIKMVNYAIDAKLYLRENNVDILILDICIPFRQGEQLSLDGGIRLLRELKGVEGRYAYPRHVIALSEHKDMIHKFSVEDGIIHTAIYYEADRNEWSIRLSECIKTVVSILSNSVQKRAFLFDVAVICALKEELEYVKEVMHEVAEYTVQDEELIFYVGWLGSKEKKISVVAVSPGQKGMSAAAAITTKVIHDFMPRYVVMTGIAAGLKNKVNMGDVVVAQYAWDYGAGKEVVEGGKAVHKNTIEQIAIDTQMETWVSRLADDYMCLAQIAAGYKHKKPNYTLRLHCGPVATGAAVIANIDKVREIQNQIRDVIAIEMEVYGVYYAAKWAIEPKPHFVAIKSVCDFADVEKDDDYHDYAAYTSARILQCLAEEYFVYDKEN